MYSPAGGSESTINSSANSCSASVSFFRNGEAEKNLCCKKGVGVVGGFFKELRITVRVGVYEVRERMEEKEMRAIEGECRRRAEENIFQMRRRGILPFY